MSSESQFNWATEMKLLLSMPRMLACSFMQSWNNPKAPFIEASLNGKVAVITGGNSGIGLETARSLALQGCEVLILCRTPTKAADAMNEINANCASQRSAGHCRALALDLADLESVKNCTAVLREEFSSSQAKKIDFFVCNGGIMLQPYSESKQGYEIHYATNHLGHFALVGGLMDLLQNHRSRIVIITGDIAVCADDASPVFNYEGKSLEAYCRSKILNQSMTRELHRRYSQTNAVYTVHPGVINSHLVDVQQGFLGAVERGLRPLFMISPEMGAQSTLTCLLSDRVPPGSYFHNVFGVTNYHPTAAREDWTTEKWEESERLCSEHGVVLRY